MRGHSGREGCIGYHSAINVSYHAVLTLYNRKIELVHQLRLLCVLVMCLKPYFLRGDYQRVRQVLFFYLLRLSGVSQLLSIEALASILHGRALASTVGYST